MHHDLKPYPAYKDSRVPWLGDVPEHWKLRPNRAAFREVNERGHADAEMLSVTITQGVIRQSQLLAGSSKKDASNEDKSTYKLVCPGDIAYNKMRAWQGAVGVSRYRGIVSPAYVVVRPRGNDDARFFHYLLRTPVFAKEAERWSYGISSDQWSLRPEQFRQIYCCLPPLPEQTAIVRFLDHADRRIRRYISAKRTLIRLLNEQKQAIIHRTVTRGLDPNVRLRPSGVEWLGDVPDHWKILPLKRIAWFKGGVGFPVHEQGSMSAEIPFLKVSDMTRPGNDQWMESAANCVSRETADRLGAYIFPASAVVFPKVGGAMLTNKRRLLRRPSCIDNNMMGCVVQQGVLEYVFLILRWLDLGRLSKPGPVPAISEGEVREIKVALPSREEQSSAVESLRTETAKLDAPIGQAEREIALLREYRMSLVADVVTGNLDVRQAGESLPAEPQEDEPKKLEELDSINEGEPMSAEDELAPVAAEGGGED